MLCFRNIPVAENLWIREGGYQDFPSKLFCLTLLNSFAGEPFSAVFQQTSGSEKAYGLAGGIKVFR